jgi:hypothetical protein
MIEAMKIGNAPDDERFLRCGIINAFTRIKILNRKRNHKSILSPGGFCSILSSTGNTPF